MQLGIPLHFQNYRPLIITTLPYLVRTYLLASLPFPSRVPARLCYATGSLIRPSISLCLAPASLGPVPVAVHASLLPLVWASINPGFGASILLRAVVDVGSRIWHFGSIGLRTAVRDRWRRSSVAVVLGSSPRVSLGALDSEMSRLERRDSGGCVHFRGSVVLNSSLESRNKLVSVSQAGRGRRCDDNCSGGWLRLAGVCSGGTYLGLPALELPASSHGLG